MEVGQVGDCEPVLFGDNPTIDSLVWWVHCHHTSGRVTVSRESPSGASSRLLSPREEVTHAGRFLADLRGRHDEALERYRLAKRSLTAAHHLDVALELRAWCERLEAQGVQASV